MSGESASIHIDSDHPVASTLRFTAGIVSVVAGVAGILESVWLWSTGSDLPAPLDVLLPEPLLSKLAFTLLSAGASLGGVLWLRGAHVGVAVCSGTWAAIAALIARPSVRFNYSEGLSPMIEFPADGRSAVAIALFIGSAALSILTHTFSGTTRHAAARLYATLGETLTSALLLVSGLTAAIQFQIDAMALGSIVVETALLPLMVATIVLQALGLGVLAGFAIARAMAIAILLAIAATALLPDLLFNRVHIPLPLFWGIACALGAASLLIPRRAIEN